MMKIGLDKRMKKLIFIFGTRPEAIKMAPVIMKCKKSTSSLRVINIVTAQHREMLDDILRLFRIQPEYDLNIMRENQSLEDVTVRSLKKLSKIIGYEKPDMILVQGDTTTTFIGALAGFYNKIPIGHIEAGLRTHDKYQPFPEEINRRLTTTLADIHFPPTKRAAENLIQEGVPAPNIFITGNTVIDALFEMTSRNYKFKKPLDRIVNHPGELILVTAHRRENLGEPLNRICLALKEITQTVKNIQILFAVHPNPKVRKIVLNALHDYKNIHLLPPLNYQTFAHIMAKSHLILTDSGGIQEEAPSLGKPVLVLRNKTERPEAVEAGTVKLVGTDTRKIVEEVTILFQNKKEYGRMAKAANPYGDGKASDRILQIILEKLKRTPLEIPARHQTPPELF
jgi:UDP-N-acetylglucosamine 2-epimerase (non-hydrolysing)